MVNGLSQRSLQKSRSLIGKERLSSNSAPFHLALNLAAAHQVGLNLLVRQTYYNNMKATERGQVTVPKKLREKYGINSSTEVEFLERNGDILLVKRGAVSSLARFRGIARTRGLPGRTEGFLALLRDGEEE